MSEPVIETRKDAIRDAATVVVVRGGGDDARVLMGQRGKGAAFMPSKYVFPGGAVDAADAALPAPGMTAAQQALGPLAAALLHAALRELREETGLHLPAPGGLIPIFRAITPPGRPRRFDARFFMAKAEGVTGDPDDFSGAEDELSHLHWVPLPEARALDLPFITEVVLAEVEARLADPDTARPMPMFHHGAPDGTGRSFIDALL